MENVDVRVALGSSRLDDLSISGVRLCTLDLAILIYSTSPLYSFTLIRRPSRLQVIEETFEQHTHFTTRSFKR
jgi:hypothetical protein